LAYPASSSIVAHPYIKLRSIIENLLTPPRWGGRHTELRNLKKGLTSELLTTKEGKKLTEKAIKELINDGLLLCKKSTGELHVSLNPEKKDLIMRFVENA